MGYRLALSVLVCIVLSSEAALAASLVKSAQKGNVAKIAQLLEKGTDVNGLDRGRLPLIEAAKAGHLEVVRRLLSAGANVQLTDGVGETALGAALASGHAALAETLLTAGADPNSSVRGENTPLMTAVDHSWATLVASLLERRAEVNAVNRKNRSALMIAVATGDTGITASLLRHGALPNQGYFVVIDRQVTRNGSVTEDVVILEAHAALAEAKTASMIALLRSHGAKDIVRASLPREADVLDTLFSRPHFVETSTYRTTDPKGRVDMIETSRSRSITLSPRELESREAILAAHGVDERVLRFFRD